MAQLNNKRKRREEAGRKWFVLAVNEHTEWDIKEKTVKAASREI